MTELPADVIQFIAAFPSLTIKDATDANTSQKVHCILTGHEMPCRIAELEEYVHGKKFKKAQERSDKQFEKYKPHIVPSNKKGRTHQLFCTLTLRHINRVPAHVDRHVNGRRYKKALGRYEECQRLGTKFKPFGRSRKREELDSGAEEAKKYSRSAFSDSSESEAESEDSMSDLYPRDYFERLSPENQEGGKDDDDSGSDFDMEDMEVGPQTTSNGASTSSAGNGPQKRKKNFQQGGKSKAAKQHQGQRNPRQQPFFKKGALKQPRKEKGT